MSAVQVGIAIGIAVGVVADVLGVAWRGVAGSVVKLCVGRW